MCDCLGFMDEVKQFGVRRRRRRRPDDARRYRRRRQGGRLVEKGVVFVKGEMKAYSKYN